MFCTTVFFLSVPRKVVLNFFSQKQTLFLVYKSSKGCQWKGSWTSPSDRTHLWPLPHRSYQHPWYLQESHSWTAKSLERVFGMLWGEKCRFVKSLKEFNLFPGFRNLRFPMLELYHAMVPSPQHFPLSLRDSRTLGAMASLTGILGEASTRVFPFSLHTGVFFLSCLSVSCD